MKSRLITSILNNFHGGFILSIPMGLILFWGFSDGGPSDANNNLALGLMAIMVLLTLPGSIILLFVGFIAAFSGKQGEFFAMLCIYLSVINAHIMGSFHCSLFRQKEDIDNP